MTPEQWAAYTSRYRSAVDRVSPSHRERVARLYEYRPTVRVNEIKDGEGR